jgi:cation diffusion facilitator family transporter
MDDCCSSKETELRNLPERQKGVLKIVLVINLSMFFVESRYGIISRSTSLLADSLDMLGDAFVYAFSLYVIGRSQRQNSLVSLLKGLIMALFGVGVIGQAVYRYFSPGVPMAETMGIVGAAALLANLACAFLLLRHRHDDINMRSTWLCSRNDVIANIGVLIAACLVGTTRSKYPDLIVGIAISFLVLRSSVFVIKEATAALNDPSKKVSNCCD